MKTLILAVFMIGIMCSSATAQSPDREFTPGPRMIRAIEQIAGSYAHLGSSLGLTAEQKDAMARVVQSMKTDMLYWSGCSRSWRRSVGTVCCRTTSTASPIP